MVRGKAAAMKDWRVSLPTRISRTPAGAETGINKNKHIKNKEISEEDVFLVRPKTDSCFIDGPKKSSKDARYFKYG
jgi:hypothetical protein